MLQWLTTNPNNYPFQYPNEDLTQERKKTEYEERQDAFIVRIGKDWKLHKSHKNIFSKAVAPFSVVLCISQKYLFGK